MTLSREFGDEWPSDHLGLDMPPVRRVMWNMSALAEDNRRREERRDDDTKDGYGMKDPSEMSDTELEVVAKRKESLQKRVDMIEDHIDKGNIDPDDLPENWREEVHKGNL